MKLLLLTGFSIISLFSIGQDFNKKIKSVQTVEQANDFISSNPELNAELIEINTSIDSSSLAIQLIGNKSEIPITSEGYTYKILNIKTSFLLRVSYIFLDGSKLSLPQIDSIRNTIISKYTNGTAFPILAKEYNMDGNPNCDFGWLAQEMFVKDFSTAVKEHKKDDIFTIDIPSNKWYYVTLKTFDDKEFKVFTILKVKHKS